MDPIRSHLGECMDQGMIEGTELRDVYRVPAVVRSALRSFEEGGTGLRPIMNDSDFFIGSYNTLSEVRLVAAITDPGAWSGTDIHHIVENHHLQYLGRVAPVTDWTYDNTELCVLFLQGSHRLAIDSMVAQAEREVLGAVKLEGQPFNFVAEFRAAHPGRERLNRAAKTKLKQQWLRDVARDRRVAILTVQQTIQRALLAVYAQVYEDADLRPLRVIAQSVVRGMPL